MAKQTKKIEQVKTAGVQLQLTVEKVNLYMAGLAKLPLDVSYGAFCELRDFREAMLAQQAEAKDESNTDQ